MVKKKQRFELNVMLKIHIYIFCESSILNGPTIEFEYKVGHVALYIYQSIIQYLKHSDYLPPSYDLAICFVVAWVAIIFNSSVADASYLYIWIITLFYIESSVSNQNWVSEC